MRTVAVAVMILAGAWLSGGCAQNELGRYSGYNPPSLRVKDDLRVRFPIVKTENYWIQREVQKEEQFPGPTPEDLKPSTADYVLGAGDLVDITVFELMQPGTPYVSRQRLSQSGQITFPYIGTVKCAGLTTRGLEDKIASMLSPDYIKDAQVTVFVLEYRNLNVSILNGVYRPGIVPMTKQDMTLLELVAYAGGVLQLTEDYGFIIRNYTPEEADILMLEAGVAPKEGEAGGLLGGPTGTATGTAKSTPAGTATGTANGSPTGTAGSPDKAGPKTDVKNGGPEGESKAGMKAGSDAAAKSAAKAAPMTPAELSNKKARELLEKMAEGDTPPVSQIEAAEAAGGADKAGPDKKSVDPQMAGPEAPAPSADLTAEFEKAAAPDITPTATAPAKAAVDAPKASGDSAAAQAMEKDEEELGQWIWSDGKFIQVKPKPGTEPVKTATGSARSVEPVKVAESPKPANAGKGTDAAKPAEATKPVEVAKTTEAVKEGKALVDASRLQLEQKLKRLGVVQGGGQLKRIIRFDVRALQSGDPTQNVVLRDSDIVVIPSPPIGDFYMGGEIARPGVYSLTGRKMTLLQAVMSAGGLTAVAVPWRTEIIRRVSETEQEIVYMDLGKISRGEAPDLYLQPEDQVRVGTDQGAIFNAVFRNAFRATYGLGSVYDMNFADFYPWASRSLPIIGASAL
jgi:polysaccharide export outer membrane protein